MVIKYRIKNVNYMKFIFIFFYFYFFILLSQQYLFCLLIVLDLYDKHIDDSFVGDYSLSPSILLSFLDSYILPLFYIIYLSNKIYDISENALEIIINNLHFQYYIHF